MSNPCRASVWNLARWFAISSFVGACSDGAADPVPRPVEPSADPAPAVSATAPPFELSEATRFYRLDLMRDADGTVTVSNLELVELEQRPLPSLSAEYLVVGYAGDEVVAAVPLVFAERGLAMGWSGDAPTHAEISVTNAVATVFVEAEPSLDRISVLAADQTVELEVQGDRLPVQPTKGDLGAQALGTSRQGLSREQLAFRYHHIRFLAPGDDAVLAKELLEAGMVIAPTDAMNDTVASGIAKLPPALLSSVQTIGVVRWPAGSFQATNYLGVALGAQLVLNADMMQDPEMELTVVHEVAHSFTFLADAAATKAQDLSVWPEEVRTSATKLVKKFRLAAGLPTLWQELHESGLAGGYTTAYTDQGWMNLSATAALAGGFASPYGSTNPWEDLAEYVGSVQSPVASTPGACPLFAGGGEVTTNDAIPYAKLVLLLGLGALTEPAFQTCVHGTVISQKPGINFPGAISFESELKAGTLKEGGGTSFAIVGAGPNTYRTLIEVALDSPDQSPLGLHRLNDIWLGNVGESGLSGAYLSNDDPFLGRAGERGLVLFTQANSEQTAGAIFGLVLQNAVGVNTDYLPLGTFMIR